MRVAIEEAYAEECCVIGEQINTSRLLDRAEQKQPEPNPVVLEEDGFKIYHTPYPDRFSVSWGGQWLAGSHGATPEEALSAGRAAVVAG